MGGFDFRLARLLRLAEAERGARAEALAQAQAATRRAQAEHQARSAACAGRLQALRGAADVVPGIDDWTAERAAYADARQRVAGAELGVHAADEAESASSAAYVRARQEREVLARLRARQEVRWRQAERNRQQALLDEVAGRRPPGPRLSPDP